MWYGGSAFEGCSGPWVLKLKSSFVGLALIEENVEALISFNFGRVVLSSPVTGSSLGWERTLAAAFATGDPRDISAAFLGLLEDDSPSGTSFDFTPIASSSDVRETAATEGDAGSNPGGGPETDDPGLEGLK